MDCWVELTGADVAATLSRAEVAGIVVKDISWCGDYTIRFRIRSQDITSFRRIIRTRSDSAKILPDNGVLWILYRLIRRPVLVGGMLLLLMITYWVPGRIFFVQVEGNTHLENLQIIETAAKCGICFGATRREVRSEAMKNALLAAVPELQWAGVNTYGCVAVITVQERNEQQQSRENNCVSSIVAARDGIIAKLTVWRGNSLCNVGQAVKAGQVLVSGYTDCGIYLQALDAEAEIFAFTNRNLTAVFSTEFSERDGILEKGKNISLIIGKKRINLYNSSGILDTRCAKIYEEKYLPLPGGFVLPIAIAVECWTTYTQAVTTCSIDMAVLQTFAQEYLAAQMSCGKILNAFVNFEAQDTLCALDGKFACYEMIGRTRPEEILTEYESN